MNTLPSELQHALRHQRLLCVWCDVPFELPPQVTRTRTALIERLQTEAAQLFRAPSRLNELPPLPILSLDPTDRIEREFGDQALTVLLTQRDVLTTRVHNLIKLAGDLKSRTGLVLSRNDVQHLPEDADKRYLLNLVHAITEHDSAVLLVGRDPAREDFTAWWPFIHSAFRSAPIFAAGDPATVWPEDVLYLGQVGTTWDLLEKTPNVNFSVKNTHTAASEGSIAIGSIQVGGNVGNIIIGDHRDIATKAPSAESTTRTIVPLDMQTLRVDAAVPEQVFVERVFDLAVAVRQMTSPVLAVKDLKHVESGEMQTAWAADTPLINLRAEVEAPECDVIGKSSIQFRLARGKDAPPIYFHLKPRHVGELSIIVTVYQADYALGSARVSTLAAEQTAPTAGKVQLTVASQPLWLDCELRIFEPIDHRYRVELTLNHEQVFSGAASHELATWVGTQDPVVAGPALFQSLLTADELRRAWDEARGRSKQRRIRLRIDPPALHALPWELLRDGAEVIAADADTPFSRYLPIGKEWGRPLTDRPVRVLAVIANPSDLTQKYDLPAANVELEEQTLRAAVNRTGQGAESLSLTFLTPPITPARLEAELRHGYHVLHFVGHGAFNTKSQQAALYFENDDRTARRVIDADFAGLLDRLQRPPQLVVLAACQSARQSLHAVFSGLAPRLVQIGLPAVVAMQADVSLLTARQFTATFYRQLSAHGTVDLAMNEARSTLITDGRFDAAVPLLFMRLRDGRLWGEAPRVPAPPSEPPPPIGRKPLPPEERESLERQLRDLRENLQVIEEHKAKYMQETDIPLQYLREERRLRAKIAELEDKLRGAN